MNLQKNIFFTGVVWKLALYISSFLLNIYLTNILGASQSGPFFYLINNIALIVQFLIMGLDISLSYFNAKQEFKKSLLFNLALQWTLLTTCIFSILFYLGLSLKLFTYDYSPLLLILYVFSSILTGLVTAIFVSSSKHLIPSLIPLLCNLLLIFYIYSLQGSNSSEFLDQYLKAHFVFSGLSSCSLLGILYFQIKPTIALWPFRFNKAIVSYSLSVFLFNLSVSLLLRGDIWLVRYLTDNKELGNYIQVGKVVQLILLLPNLASFALLPFLAQQKDHNTLFKNEVIKLSRIYFFISLIICCVTISTGYWLFPLLFGSSFDKMYITFLFITPGVLLFSASYPIDTFFSSINKNDENIRAALYSLLIMVLSDLVLIPHYSIYGAAIGCSFAFAVFFFYLLFQFKKYSIT